MAAPAPDRGRAPARRRGGDRRAPPDPLVVLVPDRPGRLAARSRRAAAGPLGRRLLWRQHGAALRGRRARIGRGRRAVRAVGVDLSLDRGAPFPGGVLGPIDCSFEQPFRCVYELVGTRGVIEVPDAYLPPARPTARLPERRLDRGLRFRRPRTSTPRWSTPLPWRWPTAEHRLPDPAEDGLAQMAVLDALLQASRAS